MTTLQIQYLLAFLGYDTGGVGNGYGPNTRKAAADFQQEFGSHSDIETALRCAVGEGWTRPSASPNGAGRDWEPWWQSIKYFSREEFRCPCGKWCNGYPVEPSEKLVRFMDAMRGDFGKAVIVVPPDGHSGGSGVRCQQYNDSLTGSVPNSYHVLGKAADFSAPGVKESAIESCLAKAKGEGKIRYWYRIGPGSYHMDVI